MPANDLVDERLERERAFHDRVFGDEQDAREEAGKFYSVTAAREEHYRSALHRHGAGRRVVELGCGPKSHAMSLARSGAHVTSIDLSPVAVDRARELAEREGVADRMTFRVMNAEQLEFPDG
jgi:ubiquinone/menaquinone biosynthesis C-methylase UbiE